MSSRKDKTCYMCDRSATTDEHAPPRCFFPKGYRKDLVTVPSCAEHNTAKSGDDEVLHDWVALCSDNPVAIRHSKTKVIPSLRRSKARGGGLLRAVMNNPKQIQIGGRARLSNDVDIRRFNSTMEKIGRAIYFHHFKKRWPFQEIDVHTTSLVMADGKPSPNASNLMVLDRAFISERFGANPEVFYYQVRDDCAVDLIKMVFYEGFKVYLFPRTKVDLPEW